MFLLAALGTVPAAVGSGPRWVAGPPYFPYSVWEQLVMWRQPTLLYYTDPGTLPGLSHADADAIVTAAAAVWNTPLSTETLTQGGALNEHVSAANTYMGTAGLVLPDDVEPSDTPAKPIAVIYDTDGSITDLLLGAGASAPSGCRQNEVTTAVDDIDNNASIQHATLIINGRCTGTSVDQRNQLQYMLQRAFGRALGLAWSQLNDDVFTGEPQAPSFAEEQVWPMMHAIDIVCGPYTYACMVAPFTLKEDDVASLLSLYPVSNGTTLTGKTPSFANAVWFGGRVQFPDNTGMGDVNVEVLRVIPNEKNLVVVRSVSAAAGYRYRQMDTSAITGPGVGVAQSSGSQDTHLDYAGRFIVGYMQILGFSGYISVYASTQPINPLYSGSYTVGPYLGTPIAMSGQSTTVSNYDLVQAGFYGQWFYMTQSSAPASCDATLLGAETAPLGADPSGFWIAPICAMGETAWRSVSAAAGHDWTLEVTGLDETGAASAAKMQPVMGVWNSTDPTGTLPTVAVAAVPLNGNATGLTQLKVAGAAADASLRLAIADMRTIGRPDFVYSARVFYAASVAPAAVSTAGGLVTVTGTGFRPGNGVLVNGVPATAKSWTATSITALLPSMQRAGAADGVPVTITLVDAATGATATVPSAVSYSSSVQAVQAVTANLVPRYVAAGGSATWSVTAQVTLAGVPAAGVTVTWTGAGALGSVTGSSVSDRNGMATFNVTATNIAAGAGGAVSACAGTNTCAQAGAVYGVPAAAWTLGIVSGAGQSVAGPGGFAPITLSVGDGAGHALLSAPVTVNQTVYADAGPCSGVRCPAAPVLATSQTAGSSDSAGTLVITPLSLPADGTTDIAVSSGSYGFVTLSLLHTQ